MTEREKKINFISNIVHYLQLGVDSDDYYGEGNGVELKTNLITELREALNPEYKQAFDDLLGGALAKRDSRLN